MKIIVQEYQSIWDIAVRYSGSIDGVIDILNANGKSDTTLLAGEELIIPPSPINKQLVDYFNKKNIEISTLTEALNPANYNPANDSNNVVIEINGILHGIAAGGAVYPVNVVDQGDSPIGFLNVNGDWQYNTALTVQKVYARPWQTQVTDQGITNYPKAGDEYYQRNNLGLWHQRPGRVMVIDETNHLMLKDLSAQGIDNTNPLGDYRRYTMTNDVNFDFSNNTPNLNVNSQGYYNCICDWLTGTMWILVIMDSNVSNDYMFQYMNTPYNGPIPHDGSPAGTYIPDWFFNTVDNCLNTTNKLIYGFDDWQVPSHAHHSSIYNHDNAGQLNAIFGGRTALLAVNNHDSTYRGVTVKRWRIDGIGSVLSINTISTTSSSWLLCREIDENDFPLNP